ncbi:MAG TPA: TIGR04222 domain-containing membrane protein [Tepidisphaeraceae bacterium]|jgi:uncharacterized protein (TIGR04222 family)
MMGPLDLSGPEFLKLYAILVVATTVGALVVRWAVTQTSAGPLDRLDAYEMGYLAGGPARVVLVAVTGLLQQGSARLERLSGRLTVLVFPNDPTLDAVRRRLADLAGEPVACRTLHATLAGQNGLIRQTLQTQSLVVRDESVWLYRMAATLLFVCLIGLGIAKITVGLERNRPVLFLAVMTLAAVGIMIVLLRTVPRLTRGGRQTLRQLRAQRPRQYGRTPNDETVALWGVDVFSGQRGFESIHAYFHTPTLTGSGGSGGCSSGGGSGGSSCGGGGGCGGCGSS